MVTAAMKSEDKPRQCVERQIHHSADKGNVKAMLFPVNWTINPARQLSAGDEHGQMQAVYGLGWERD